MILNPATLPDLASRPGVAASSDEQRQWALDAAWTLLQVHAPSVTGYQNVVPGDHLRAVLVLTLTGMAARALSNPEFAGWLTIQVDDMRGVRDQAYSSGMEPTVAELARVRAALGEASGDLRTISFTPTPWVGAGPRPSWGVW